MKKFLVIIFILSVFFNYSAVFAVEQSDNTEIEVPKWEDYVPKKYQNPRDFPYKGRNIAELSVGITCTLFLFTIPIGVPMIVHATTKMKNSGWYRRKMIFEDGLIEAEKISDLKERQRYYDRLLFKCGMQKKINNEDKFVKFKFKKQAVEEDENYSSDTEL